MNDLKSEDFGGEKYDGCNEYLVVTSPESVIHVHKEFLEAGADVIETNTFGATSVVLSEYGLENEAFRINQKAAEKRTVKMQLANENRKKAKGGESGDPEKP